MPRHLPWKTSPDPGTERGQSIKPQPVRPESPRLPALKSPHARPAPASATRTPFKKARRDHAVDPDDGIRSPSTSPPPEVPVERFMIPGPLHDDRYRMVEDEFLTVAHQFTTHLHRAEYNRLKNLAKTQNAATIREIERPTVGTPTLLTRQRHDSARQIAKQQKVMQSGSHNAHPSRMATSLQGLMESPRKESKWILSTTMGPATTRAAAGFQSNLSSPPKPLEAPRGASSVKKRRLPGMDDDTTTDGSGEEDLVTPTRGSITKPARVTQSSSAASRSTPWPLSTPRAAVAVSSPKNSPNPRPSTHRPRVAPAKPGSSWGNNRAKVADEASDNNDDDDDDPFGIAKRRIRRQQSKDQFRRAEQNHTSKPRRASPDNIPSFM